MQAARPRLLCPAIGEQGEAGVGHAHQDQAEQHRALHADLRIEHAADEDADQIGPEADADVPDRDLVIGVAHVVEQQPEHELAERVADLVEQDEEQDEQRALAHEEFGERPARSRPTASPRPLRAVGSRCRSGSPTIRPVSIAGSAKTAQAR